MQRFTPETGRGTVLKRLLPLIVSAAILILFAAAVGSVSQSSTEQQKSNLEQAVRRNIVQCYITEGSYPESLKYLEDNYPILYDRDIFYIDYQPIGENIMPEVTILCRQ